MNGAATWGGIAAIVITAIIGDVLQARAMKEIGDLGVIRKSHGVFEVARRILTNPWFMSGLFFMALAFFSLLVTLSWDDVSIVGPASASLTFLPMPWLLACFSASALTIAAGSPRCL
jgi:hypothetical protein